MYWEKMTIDEYAELEERNGAKLSKVNDIWWREVRPFFYRPLFPFTRIAPQSMKPPPASVLVGYQHLVSDPAYANSHMNLMVFDEIDRYTINAHKSDRRKWIKKGRRNFLIEQVRDLHEFINSGFRVYKSFYARTHYKWNAERRECDGFAKWAKSLFDSQKVLILGAYLEGMLSAVAVSYLVENIIIFATYFAETGSLKANVSDIMWHHVREMASQCQGATLMSLGLFIGREGLDYFKLSRGAKVIAEPAYYYINPILLFLMKHLKRKDYEKLVGLNEEQINDVLKGAHIRISQNDGFRIVN
jgi:hypothetical protein